MCGFRPLPKLQYFEERLFRVIPIGLEANATVFSNNDRVEQRCAELFPKYWIESKFLMGSNVYVYKEGDLSDEDLYQKKQLMSFIGDLGYFEGNFPMEEVDRKCLYPHFLEERKVIFGKLQKLLAFLPLTCVMVKKYMCACYPYKGMGTQRHQQVYNNCRGYGFPTMVISHV